MNRPWLICIVCVALLTIFIVYSANCLRSPICRPPQHNHFGYCHFKQPHSMSASVNAANTAPLVDIPLNGANGKSDIYTNAAGIGLIGGAVYGSVPADYSSGSCDGINPLQDFGLPT